MTVKLLNVICIVGGAVGSLYADAINTSIASRRLFSIAGISLEEVDQFSARCTVRNAESNNIKNPLRVWRKWSFGESVSTLTEVTISDSKVLIENWVVKKTGNNPSKWDCHASKREFGPDVALEIESYVNKQFTTPLPVTFSEKPSYKSADGVDILEEVSKKGGSPKGWAVRSAFLIGDEDYQKFSRETLVVARLLKLPSF